MEEKGAILTKEERDVLVLAAAHPNYQHYNNTEIAQRLGISVSKVKTLIHQACVKLGANNRNNAIISAVIQGEIRINEFLSFDELAELISALHPDTLRRIAHFVREWLEHGYLPGEDEQIIRTDRRQDTVLTKSEQDVLALVGRGLTNREIADTLYVSINTVGTFLHRVCAKLGARNRTEAFALALKRKEIGIGDIYTLNEVIPFFAPLGADTLEKIAQQTSQRLEQETVQTNN